jgi:heterotetrameric sarcosine oxidase gamma subunit
VAELRPSGAFDGLGLPLEAGGCRLAALPEQRRASVAPFAGREAAVAAALGVALPRGRVAALASGRVLPFALGHGLVEGAEVAGLEGLAAVADQSDGWAGLALAGAAAADGLARLVPLDLDPSVFRPGAAARSQLGQVPLVLVAVGGGFELLVPRSYARTAVRELGEALRGVAARAGI